MSKDEKKKPARPRDRRVTNPKKPKSTAAEYDRRVNVVLQLLLAGAQRWQIIENVTNKEGLHKWKVCNAQIDKYIKSANDVIIEQSKEEKNKIFACCYGRFDFLYRRLVSAQDYKGATAAVKAFAELTGVNAAIKSEIDIHNGAGALQGADLSKLNNDELRTLIELQRKSGIIPAGVH